MLKEFRYLAQMFSVFKPEFEQNLNLNKPNANKCIIYFVVQIIYWLLFVFLYMLVSYTFYNNSKRFQ